MLYLARRSHMLVGLRRSLASVTGAPDKAPALGYSTRMPRLFLVLATALAGLAVYAAPARAQLTDPFDHLHLAVPDVERARDWYVQHMEGNPGETPETVAWGKWPGD